MIRIWSINIEIKDIKIIKYLLPEREKYIEGREYFLHVCM